MREGPEPTGRGAGTGSGPDASPENCAGSPSVSVPMRAEEGLTYEATDRVGAPVALGIGVQVAILALHFAVLLPTIVFRAADAESFLLWAIFAGMVVSGVSTVVQAVRVGRFGAGYLMVQGGTSAYIAVCVVALVEGGPPLLATLVVATGLIQAAFSERLALLHRILTPVVTGTVIMLLPVTVMPIVFRMVNELPAGAPPAAGPLCTVVTLAAAVGVHLKAAGRLRLWAPVAGIAAGSAVGGVFGIYDTGLVAGAAWFGLPEGRPPGLDLGFGPSFWALLPAFLFIGLVAATKSVGVAVATQRVSWRTPRAVDFRSVQGAVAAEGGGNVLGGLAGALPNTLHPSPVAAIEMTGVAARSVGVVAGLVLIVLACVPKLVAVIVAIPDAVVAASIAVFVSILFVVGMREVVSGTNTSPRNGLIAGLSVWIGIGVEFDLIFPEFLERLAGGLLSHGMTTGGSVAVLLTLLTMPRVARLSTRLDVAELPRINEFIRRFARRHGLQASVARMEGASEETLLMLLESRGAEAEAGGDGQRELQVAASREAGDAVLRFRAAAAGGEEVNLQDRLVELGDEVGSGSEEQDISLRLLRHLASSVRHQQYRDVDIVTLKVAAGRRSGRGP